MSSLEQPEHNLISVAEGDQASNADDTHSSNQKQTSGADIERECGSEKAGEIGAGAFKIYVVDPHPFLERRSGPGFPPGGAFVAPYEQLPYEQGWWLQHLHQFTLSQLLIDESDVEIYDWEEQKLIMTEQAAHRLREEPNSMDLGNIFVVTLGEERLYGGVLVSQFSPRFVHCPVLSWEISRGDQWALLLFPTQEGRGGGRALMQRINMEAIRSHFLSLGKLSVAPGRSQG